MAVNRRQWLAAAGVGLAAAGETAIGNQPKAPSLEELDQAAQRPVLNVEGLASPVLIDSIRLLRKGDEYLVHVRSKDGAEGVSVPQPGAPDQFHPILTRRVIPPFLGKDARKLEDVLWEAYRHASNYKLYGLAFWSCQAWVEFAILDMLGRMVNKPMGTLLGGVIRQEIPFYVASGRRDTTPPEEIENLRKLLEQSGAKAVKFRVGGRMSRNEDAMPNRTKTLIPLVRKSLGDSIDIHADSNSSYDPPQAIEVGRMLEDIKAVYFEEPCPFDHLEETRKVADALDIPIAGGEQEYSDWRFRWTIANRGVDIVQPDLQYYGGLIRSIRVARMADLAAMPTTVHISGGFGFVYMLHFASCVKDPGRYQEYKLGTDKYGKWFDPPIRVQDGKMTVPTGPGVGIADLKGLLADARPVA
ncbi:MAG: mandelate racemase/muconate lactonizing enzyme family protein [Acidobacteriota bacterium]